MKSEKTRELTAEDVLGMSDSQLVEARERVAPKYENERCTAGEACEGCTFCICCSGCSGCTYCWRCTDCTGCSDCSYCSGLNSARYMLCNVQLTQEQYEQWLKGRKQERTA